MGQQRYRRNAIKAQVGQTRGVSRVTSLVNNAPRTAQVATYTVDTAANSTDYTIEIDGVAITVTSDASGTKAEIALLIQNAINAENLVNGMVVALDDDTDSVAVTARLAGYGFTATTSDDNMSVVQTTANDDADPVPYGVAVIQDSTSTDYGRQVLNTAMTAQAVVITPTNVNDATYHVNVKVDGVEYVGHFTADGSATVKEIVEGLAAVLNAVLPASTVIATEDDAALTLTSEIRGKPFSYSYGADDATVTWTVTDNSTSSLTDINRCIKGISMYSAEYGMTDAGVAQYPENSAMSILEEGEIAVATEESIDNASDVWLGVTGTDQGLWRKSVGTTAANWIRLDRAKFAWVENLSSTLGVLRVNV